MQIVWAEAARLDIAVIRAHIGAENPRAAERQVRLVINAIARLLDFPQLGRIGRIEGTRELVVSRTPYLVAYRLAGNRIEILRVLHGRQRWPDRL
jgi:addiction module RelE/StbE family toxin